jgi:hypothetical protein
MRRESRKGLKVVYGTNRELTTVQCCVCKKFVAMRFDKDDLARHLYGGVLIRDCMPYLSGGEREILLTATCPDCWALLCVDPVLHPLAYS